MPKASKTDPTGGLTRLGAAMNDQHRRITLLQMELATDKRKIAGLRQIVQRLETKLRNDNGGKLPELPGPGALVASTLLPSEDAATLRDDADKAIGQIAYHGNSVIEHQDMAGWGMQEITKPPIEVCFWRKEPSNPAWLAFTARDDGLIDMEGKGVDGESVKCTYLTEDIKGRDYLFSVVEAVLDLDCEPGS